jgi:hypothetical protein
MAAVSAGINVARRALYNSSVKMIMLESDCTFGALLRSTSCRTPAAREIVDAEPVHYVAAAPA